MTANLRNSLLISLAAHVALLGIFFLIRVQPSVLPPEEVEIGFVGPAPSRTEPRHPAPAVSPPPAPQPVVSTQTPKVNQTVVALPKRRMQEEDEPLLPIRPEKKISAEETPLPLPEEKPMGTERSPIPGLPQKAVIEGDKGLVTPVAGKTGETKETPSVTENTGKGENRLFKIEGEASHREILSKVLPSYPKGTTGEGVVKLKFTVLPNGLVGDVLPLVKADPVLEKVTIEAFQQWRFNPLPANQPQKTATGVITFRYVLK